MLLREHWFADRAALDAYVAELRSLQQDPQDRYLAWKHGLGPAMRDERLKLAELHNWLELVVMPVMQRRH